ncbi:FAD dependent oxidoreductase [hydrothermal vent metagenome]|uniref:FAD dependent oxidoreductase n=1 Tax=hydrothermal vent metagenome TaxID=652676 RepID=A0A1W1C6G8_9ZZZZ
MPLYDVAIVGAGINGSALAYRLSKEGLSVALFDSEIAGGGSGAAGAFLSPKFLKSSDVKTIINEALDEAFDFYEHVDSTLIERHPLLHIAKDERDAKNIRYIKEHHEVKTLQTPPPFIPKNEYIFTDKSAIVSAKEMCKKLAKSATLHHERITKIEKDKGLWSLNEKSYRAKNVVLATGAYSLLVDEAYLQEVLRGIWGHRIDVASEFKSDTSIHQYVSISPSKDGVLSIGATHDVHFKPDKGVAYNYQKGREELISKANQTVALGEVKVLRDYVGLRSGSIDHLPIVGKVANLEATLKKLGSFELKKKPQDFDRYLYHDGLYMINGSAGYGFVLAPMLTRLLCNAILNDEPIPSKIEPTRFLPRYVRRVL